MVTADVAKAYSRRSAEYIDLFGSLDHVHPADLQLLSGWADGLVGPVLDAGCGPGQWSDFLARRGLAARGIDQVPEFIERARRAYPGVPFEVERLDALGDESASLGGVLAWYSIIHHEPEAVDAVLEEFARVLRPGGGLLIGFFTGTRLEPFAHAVITAHRWPPAELADRVRAAGFDVLDCTERIEAGARPQGAIVARRTSTTM